MQKISKILFFLVPIAFVGFFLMRNKPPQIEQDFETLMGKGSEAWQYVETREDRQNLAFFRKLYEKNHALISRPESIPHTLHFIWLGPQEFPKDSQKNIASWIQKHPGWSVKYWTDIDRKAPHPQMQKVLVQESDLPHLLSCYYKSDNYGEKSLILRYEVLHREGGLYVDHDVFCRQNVDALQKSYDFYCSLDEIQRPILSSSIFPSAHLIAAKPQHPVLLGAIEWLSRKWEELEAFYPGTDPLAVASRVKHRGFSALQEGIFYKIDKEGRRDIVFPKEVSFAKHTHEGTWIESKSESEKKWDKELDALLDKEGQIQFLLLFLLGITAPLLILFKKKKFHETT